MKTTKNFTPTEAFSHVNHSTTFGELKRLLPSTGKERVPGITQLRKNAVVVLHAKTESGIVEVYDNGFFTYMEDGHITVYAVDRCTVLEWYSCTGEKITSEGANLSELPWTMPLEIAGSNRLEHNSDSRQDSRSDFSINSPASANNLKFSVRPEHEIREEREEQAHIRACKNRMIAAEYSKLRPRQKKLIRMVFFEKMRHEDVAAALGIDRTSVSHSVDALKKRFEKFL